MPTDLNSHLQDCAIRLLITDDDFCRLAAGRLDPRHFTSSLTEAVGRLCLDYWLAYKRAPGDHFHDELVRFLTRLPEADRADYHRYVAKLHEMSAPNRDYVLRRVDDFIQCRETESALVQAADLTADGKVAEARELLHKSLRSGIPEHDAGLDYLYDHSGISQREYESHLMPTGVPALDRVIGGYDRGTLWAYMGGPKGGKTWGLTHIGKTAVLRGLRVTHVTCEVSAQEQELRYDMAFTARAKSDREIEYMVWDEQSEKFAHRRIRPKSIYDVAAVAAARKAVRRMGGALRIRKFPMGQCRPAQVEEYVSYLEEYEGHATDVLIVDYVDIMDLGAYAKETRDKLNAAYEWAKGLADDRQILVWTASQVRREAIARRRIRKADAAEDIRKIANVDGALAIGRSEADINANLAGLNVVAHRTGREDLLVSVSLCWEIGQLCLSSWIGSELDDSVYAAFGGDGAGKKN